MPYFCYSGRQSVCRHGDGGHSIAPTIQVTLHLHLHLHPNRYTPPRDPTHSTSLPLPKQPPNHGNWYLQNTQSPSTASLVKRTAYKTRRQTTQTPNNITRHRERVPILYDTRHKAYLYACKCTRLRITTFWYGFRLRGVQPLSGRWQLRGNATVISALKRISLAPDLFLREHFQGFESTSHRESLEAHLKQSPSLRDPCIASTSSIDIRPIET